MKHILFDLDGTLIDSAPSILSCFARVLDKRGINPKCELTNTLIGPPLILSLEKITGVTDKALLTELANDFKSNYDETGYRETREYPGVTPVLEALSGGGKCLYVVTNKRILPTRKIIEVLNWRNFFKGIYAPDYFYPTLQSKSDAINRVVEMHRISTQDAVYVGDRMEDLHAASKSRIRFLGVMWGYGGSKNALSEPQKMVSLLS